MAEELPWPCPFTRLGREALGISHEDQFRTAPLQISTRSSRLGGRYVLLLPPGWRYQRPKWLRNLPEAQIKNIYINSRKTQPVTLHLDATNRRHQESPSPLLASWRNRLHSRRSITVSEIQSLSLFPWADMNRKPLEYRTRTSEFTADVRWQVGRAGRKESKQWTNGLLTDTHFPKYNFTGRIESLCT